MKKSFFFLSALLLTVGSMAQNITLDWVQTETYQVDNSHGSIAFDQSTGDIVSGMFVWLDSNNMNHAHAINRRNSQGMLLHDTVFNDSSYLDYQLRGFYPKNGETYYCLDTLHNGLLFEKLDATGHLVWKQLLARGQLFFAYDWSAKGNTYVIDDSLNNRMLWCFEQYSTNYLAKGIGVLATNNTTGAITVLDTLYYSGPDYGYAYSFEIERDQNNHLYMTSTNETGGMLVSLLENGQFVTVAAIDSAGYRDYPQSMEIVGNTLFLTTQTEVGNNTRISKLSIYSIDASGHLTLISAQNYSDTQQYLTGLKAYGNYCYLYTSDYPNFTYPQLVPTIWKFGNTGNLVNTFMLPGYTGKDILNFSATDHALYCSMYTTNYNTLELIHPAYGFHLATYDFLNEFTAYANDAAYELEARSTGVLTDELYAAGNQWSNGRLHGRLAKYQFQGLEDGVEETEGTALFSLYPNPAGEQVFLNYTGDNYTFELLDLQGRILLTQNAQAQQERVDLSGLSSGVYFIRVKDADKVMVQRFVKD